MKAFLGFSSACLAMIAFGAGANADLSSRGSAQAYVAPVALPHALSLAQTPSGKRLQHSDDVAPNDAPQSDALGSGQLSLVIEGGQAQVCQLKSSVLMCAVVDAPLPQGTTVNYWHLPDGNSALTYTRAPGIQGVPDPTGEATLLFQAAFNGAARAVLNAPASALISNRGLMSRAVVCENEDCTETDEDEDEDEDRGDNDDVAGNSGGGRWWWRRR
jgi:hypothetical protein